MSLFRYFALNDNKTATLRTLKVYWFALGAWQVKHANRKVLKIALPVDKREWMDGLFSQIKNLSPTFTYSNT